MSSAVVGRLATLDDDGYPHVTPIWFHWDGQVVRMTSLPDRPHIRRLRHDARVGFVVDAENGERSDGQRPNRQVRMIGDAVLRDDEGGAWTKAITLRYLCGPGAEGQAQSRSSRPRVAIDLRPSTIVAVASI
jgi:hypothetical protein